MFYEMDRVIDSFMRIYSAALGTRVGYRPPGMPPSADN